MGLGGGEGHPVVAECDRVVLGAALALCGPRDPVRIALFAAINARFELKRTPEFKR